MRAEEYKAHDALGLAALVRSAQVGVAELLDTAIAQIEVLNPPLNAVIRTRYDAARREAQQVDSAAPFAGVPFLVKDIVANIAGEPTGCGNRLCASIDMPRDSELVRRYRAAGLVMLGRTNTPEFGLTPYTEPQAFGVTRNPWSSSHSPGGSSGGSAAAVAARMLPMASASDGGGSIRIPASCCGLFGFKPSRGLTPTGPDFGEFWSGFAIEHVLSRSVRDSAAMLDATAGIDAGAPYAAPGKARPYLDEVTAAPRPLRIAYSSAPLLGGHDVHADCVAAVAAGARLLEGLGHRVEEAAPPVDREALAMAFVTVLGAELRNQLDIVAEAAGRSIGPGDCEILTYALGLLGSSLTATAYVKAKQTLQLAARTIAPFFEQYDVLLTPTLATPPIRIGALQPVGPERAILQMINHLNASWLFRALNLLAPLAAKTFDYIPFTPLFNATGQPAMSVPLYWNGAGLPVGVQFVAKFGGDAVLFQLAGQLEQAQPWFDRAPLGY